MTTMKLSRRAALSVTLPALATTAVTALPALASPNDDHALKARLAPIIREMRGLDTATTLGETYEMAHRFAGQIESAIGGELPAPTEMEAARRELAAIIHGLRNPADGMAITYRQQLHNLELADRLEVVLEASS